MKKLFDIAEKISVEDDSKAYKMLLNPNIYYHGIGFDLEKLMLILESGIKSVGGMKTDKYVNSIFGHTPKNRISVVVSPILHLVDMMGGSYTEGITFICEGKSVPIMGAMVKSEILYEGLVSTTIPLEQIKGIMLPRGIADTPIKDIDINFSCGEDVIVRRMNNLIEFMKTECDYEVSDEFRKNVDRRDENNKNLDQKCQNEEMESIETKRKRHDDIYLLSKNLEKDLKLLYKDLAMEYQNAFNKKLGKEGDEKDVTMRDIISLYTNLPIYCREDLFEQAEPEIKAIRSTLSPVRNSYHNERGR